jgi:hypothetical protein
MSLQVEGSVLPFTITWLIYFLEDLSAQRLRSLVVRVDIINKHSEGLGPAAELRGRRGIGSGAFEHDPGVAEMELSALRRLAPIAVVFDEPKGPGQPFQSIADVLINDVG